MLQKNKSKYKINSIESINHCDCNDSSVHESLHNTACWVVRHTPSLIGSLPADHWYWPVVTAFPEKVGLNWLFLAIEKLL